MDCLCLIWSPLPVNSEYMQVPVKWHIIPTDKYNMQKDVFQRGPYMFVIQTTGIDKLNCSFKLEVDKDIHAPLLSFLPTTKSLLCTLLSIYIQQGLSVNTVAFYTMETFIFNYVSSFDL